MAAEKLPVQVACRTLAVSESSFYEHRNRTPSERSIRHAMLTDLITEIHTAATHRVERNFNRSGPDQLCVTHITEHPTT